MKTPTIFARIIGAKARAFPGVASDLYLGPQEAFELSVAAREFDVDGSRIFGMTVHATAEPGVAVA